MEIKKGVSEIAAVTNELSDVDVGTKFVGHDDNSKNTYLELNKDIYLTHRNELQSIKRIESFGIYASENLSHVASKIVKEKNLTIAENLGFDEVELLNKFINMKCSLSYKKEFDATAGFFGSIDSICRNDSIEGGGERISILITFIRKLYYEFYDKFDGGDLIHNAIVDAILNTPKNTHEEFFAANALVFYSIRECAIFNEKK